MLIFRVGKEVKKNARRLPFKGHAAIWQPNTATFRLLE